MKAMRRGYIDTSVLVAIAFDEPGSRKVTRAVRSLHHLYASTLLEAELLSAAEREGVRSEVGRLLQPIHWVHPIRRLSQELDRILGAGYLRGADLYHLATAAYVFPEPAGAFFLTLDERQERRAADLGFRLLGEA